MLIAQGAQDGQFGDADDFQVKLPEVNKGNKRKSGNKTHLR
jgi:hypothetical protein